MTEPSAWNNLDSGLQVIAPGLVYLKQALSEDQQRWLAKYAIDAGNRKDHGFWIDAPGENGESTRVLNSDKGRGRIYDDVLNFPDAERVEDLCHKLVACARNKDSKMPEMNPTHLLLLYYATHDGMEWHSDSDKNDGNNDHPIVSICIGNSCDFGYKIVAKQAQTLQLNSGDVLIWGGPNRMLLHCVEKVHQNTCPDFLQDLLGNVRLNFTYRDAPNVRGEENKYKYNWSGINIESDTKSEVKE
jgi:alkylated DNA repair dioxygenase AlkB